MLNFVYSVIPAAAGALGWYGLIAYLEQQNPITEHADWVIGLAGFVITMCLGIIGWLLARFHMSINDDVAEIKHDISELRTSTKLIGEQVVRNTEAIKHLHPKRRG